MCTQPVPATALTDFQLRLEEESYRYRTPMKFGGRVVTDVTVLNVHCEAKIADGRRANGLGSMTMGVAWAWPDANVPAAKKLDVVLEIARRMAREFEDASPTGHPIEICVGLRQDTTLRSEE
ncbi:MAG: hypothetical protein ACF787_05980, partial [Rhodopirellula sp. JB053]